MAMTDKERIAADLGTTAGSRAAQMMHNHALLLDDPKDRLHVAFKVIVSVAGAATAYAAAVNPSLADEDPFDIAIEVIKMARTASKKRP